MFKEAFKALENEINKSRISQSLTFQNIDYLVEGLTTTQVQQLARLILLKKPKGKRTNIDNYILTRCVQCFEYFKQIYKNRGEKPLMQICKSLDITQCPADSYIFKTGDLADKLYIVMNGLIAIHLHYSEVFIDELGQSKTVDVIKVVARYKPGQIFGQTSFRENSKRVVSAFVEKDSELFELKKQDYEIINKYMIASSMRQKFVFFEEIQPFSKISKLNLENLLYLTDEKQISINSVLYTEGDEIDYVYIVKSGQFKISRNMLVSKCVNKQKLRIQHNSNKSIQTAIVGPREVIGDLEILKEKSFREQTCVSITQSAEVFRIKKKDYFMKVLQDQRSNDLDAIFEYATTKQLFKFNRASEVKKTYYGNIYLNKTTPIKVQNFGSGYDLRSEATAKVFQNLYNREEEQKLVKKKKRYQPEKKKRTISNKRSKELLQNGQKMLPFSYKLIEEIVQQKKIYSSLRPSSGQPIFQFFQMPIHLKMKLINKTGPQQRRLQTMKQQRRNTYYRQHSLETSFEKRTMMTTLGFESSSKEKRSRESTTTKMPNTTSPLRQFPSSYKQEVNRYRRISTQVV